MQRNFEACLKHVLRYEGGYSDHKLDPGGATNFGITQNVLSDWRGKNVTKNDVRNLTVIEAAEIYRTKYWDAVLCDTMPGGIDLALFDCAVNQGVSSAKRFLQKALGVRVDGQIGPITMEAVENSNTSVLLCEFMARRMQHYGGLRYLFPTFGLGWSRRLMATYDMAEYMRTFDAV